MSTRTSPWNVGIPCWVNLGTPDLTTAKSFYGAVLGWTFEDSKDGSNAIAQSNGSAAAGIGTTPDDASRWTLYFASDNIDKLEVSVRENGGNVTHSTRNIGSLGRMFVATDPAGGEFGVWQAGTHIGAGIVNEAGALTWEDLRSTDPDSARDFYTALFGYTYEAIPMAGEDYSTFALPGEEAPAGGMGGMMGDNTSTSHWLIYFVVSDANAAVAIAEANNGSVLSPIAETPYGAIAALADPAGASFCVIQPPADMPVPNREG